MAEKTVNVVVNIRQTKGDPYRLIKKFTKKVKKERILEDYLSRRYYEKPSAKRRREKAKKLRNAQKAEAARNKKLDIRQVTKMAVDAKTGQAIYPGVPGVGLNHAGAYQASGAPWVTGSALICAINSGSIRTYRFPRVAKSITVQTVSNKVYTANGDGSIRDNSDPIFIFFGEPKNIEGTAKAGDNAFIVDTTSPKYSADATSPPLQYSQAHAYSLTYMSGANSSGGSFTTTIKTDHINVAVAGLGGAVATGSFQIFAELTNIPASRMPGDYISGSGVNTL